MLSLQQANVGLTRLLLLLDLLARLLLELVAMALLLHTPLALPAHSGLWLALLTHMLLSSLSLLHP